jgi:hypothetical protein
MPRLIKNLVPLGLAAVLALDMPQAASACSACMGRSDSQAAQGLNAAVATLLVTLLLVLGSAAGSVAYLVRRSIKHPLALPSTPGGSTR